MKVVESGEADYRPYLYVNDDLGFAIVDDAPDWAKEAFAKDKEPFEQAFREGYP